MKKNVNIYIQAGKSVFYANFRVKRNCPERGIISVQINRSTGTATKAVAQKIANGMRDKALEGLFDTVPKLRDTTPKIGDLCDRFLERARIRTAGAVVADFLTVVAEGAGIPMERRDEARKLKLTVLTAKNMIEFRDRRGQGRTSTTITKMMRSARSMFSRRAKEFYGGMPLPDLTGWMGVSLLPGSKDKRFRRLPDEVLATMDAQAGMMLRFARMIGRDTPRGQRWRIGWATYQLIRRCGLRNDEVANLRWEWLRADKAQGKFWLDLVEREYWKPKGTSGSVPLAPDLYAALLAEFGPEGEPRAFVLPGTPNARWAGTHVQVNQFVRRFMPDREKGVYELRKQWGSEMARRYGLETAASLLRHSGTQTAWDHYFDDLRLDSVEAL